MDDEGLGVERRINLRLLAYWERLRRGRAMPTLEEFNPADLPDLRDSCFIVHIAELSKPDGTYGYVGTAIADAYDNGSFSGSTGNLISRNPAASAGHFLTVAQSGRPLLDEGEFTNGSNRLVKYRQCLLPLGQEGTVQAVCGGMHYKIAAPAAAGQPRPQGR
jgi:hypothetical protein